MSDAIFDKTIVDVNVSNLEKSVFQAKGQVVKFEGYLKAQNNTSTSNKKDILLPELKEGEILKPKIKNKEIKYNYYKQNSRRYNRM